jgi:hypothetical protein
LGMRICKRGYSWFGDGLVASVASGGALDDTSMAASWMLTWVNAAASSCCPRSGTRVASECPGSRPYDARAWHLVEHTYRRDKIKVPSQGHLSGGTQQISFMPKK